jgi:hypothetical protein
MARVITEAQAQELLASLDHPDKEDITPWMNGILDRIDLLVAVGAAVAGCTARELLDQVWEAWTPQKWEAALAEYDADQAAGP